MTSEGYYVVISNVITNQQSLPEICIKMSQGENGWPSETYVCLDLVQANIFTYFYTPPSLLIYLDLLRNILEWLLCL